PVLLVQCPVQKINMEIGGMRDMQTDLHQNTLINITKSYGTKKTIHFKIYIMRKLFSFCIVLFLTGCDYYGDYHFEIKNEIENKDIQIKIEVNREIEKDTFNLSSFAKERIFTIGSGNIGRNEDPFDRYTEAITVFGVF